MKVNRKELRNVTAILACAAGIVLSFPIFGLSINLSSSHVPVGIWRSYPADELSIGDIIAYDVREFFRAEPQICEERLRYASPMLLKRVAALPGAFIERSGDAVVIDGTEYPRAEITDESWRKVEYPLVVPEGSVWLMADAERAWDSRYHGPLPRELVMKKKKPVLVWQ